MKIRCIMMSLCLCSLLLLSCNNESNLLEMTYDSQNSAKTMTLEGKKYFLIGATPNDIKRDQKIAIVKPEKGLPKSYVYTIKGYDKKNFLIVEERTEGVVLCTYSSETVNDIPWKLLAENDIISGNEHIKFNNKKYYYFSKTPSDFLVDKELSKIKVDNKMVSVYKTHGKPESEWIAIKDEEGYRLYWIRETALPREYLELWQNQ